LEASSDLSRGEEKEKRHIKWSNKSPLSGDLGGQGEKGKKEETGI